MQGINQLFAPALVEVSFPGVSPQESSQPSLPLGIRRNGRQPPLSRGSGMRSNLVTASSVMVDFVTQAHESTEDAVGGQKCADPAFLTIDGQLPEWTSIITTMHTIFFHSPRNDWAIRLRIVEIYDAL